MRGIEEGMKGGQDEGKRAEWEECNAGWYLVLTFVHIKNILINIIMDH